MAVTFNIKARHEIALGNLDYIADTLKWMLVKDTYVHSNLRDFVDDGTANDPLSHECDATGYTGGFGGAGRKTLTGESIVRNNGANRIELVAPNVTWTALGGTVDNTIGGALLIKEVTDDTATIIICFDDGLANRTTNGNDFEYRPNSSGVMYL